MVLSRGKPVARISPILQHQDEREVSRRILLSRLEKCRAARYAGFFSLLACDGLPIIPRRTQITCRKTVCSSACLITTTVTWDQCELQFIIRKTCTRHGCHCCRSAPQGLLCDIGAPGRDANWLRVNWDVRSGTQCRHARAGISHPNVRHISDEEREPAAALLSCFCPGQLEAFARSRAVVVTLRERRRMKLSENLEWETLVFSVPDDTGRSAAATPRYCQRSQVLILQARFELTRIAEGLPGIVSRRTDEFVEIPFGAGLYWLKQSGRWCCSIGFR